ncbi:MAG TPA: hypothetical protein VFD66_06195 [Verrucomicrobiae bacterium]|nr:hypothetical protein [Verrucomicrobiae bacterium]
MEKRGNETLTLTLSHPMGEGTVATRFGLDYAMVCSQRVDSFSLSHPMEEGWGEGFLFTLVKRPYIGCRAVCAAQQRRNVRRGLHGWINPFRPLERGRGHRSSDVPTSPKMPP